MTYTIKINKIIYDIYVYNNLEDYTLIKIYDKAKETLILCSRIWNDVKHLYNDIYNINTNYSIQDVLYVLFAFIRSDIVECKIPYFHVTQYINDEYFSDVKSFEDVFKAVPAYIPLHEYHMKMNIFNDICKDNHLQDIHDIIKTYRKIVSNLLYIVWSINIYDVDVRFQDVELIEKQVIIEHLDLEIIPEDQPLTLS